MAYKLTCQEWKCLSEASDTCKYFENKTIFITGATGFCGKVIIEKFARIVFQCKKIYILIRNKKGKNSQQRLDELLHSRIFSFHEYSDEQLKKFQAVSGDFSLSDLGLSEEDKHKLFNEVNIIYNIAASVKFNATFKFNFDQNTLGTKHIVDLTKNFLHLNHFIHVSTAFVNCQLDLIDEKVLDFKEDIFVIINNILKIKDENELDEYVSQFYDGRPNSYILTKAMAECYIKRFFCSDLNNDLNNNDEKNESENSKLELINLNSDQIDLKNTKNAVIVSIIRPSIVYNSIREPIEGWIDSMNGPSGFSLFIFIGLIRYMRANFINPFQCVPVDYLCNFLISYPVLIEKSSPISSFNVVNIASYNFNKVKAYDVLESGFKIIKDYQSIYALRKICLPPPVEPENTIIYCTKRFIFEDLWCYFMEILLFVFCLRNKISMVLLLKKYKFAIKLMNYFANCRFEFITDNYVSILNLQSKMDENLFNFNFKDYTADKIAKTYIIGSRRYLLNEPDSTLFIANFKYKIQLFLSYAINKLMWLLVGYFTYKLIFNLIK